jgi:glycosyltransferase involved in cell wall biosynthesis
MSTLKAPYKILHAPSSKFSKGTADIVKAIENLRSKGYQIELAVLSGVPNSEVRAAIARCDFVVDQLYSDTPMAAFVSEAAAMGKVAIVGGYFQSDIKKYVAEEEVPPSVYVQPEEIEGAIEGLLNNPQRLLELSQEVRRFVETRWSSKAVATRYLRLINDDVPDEWWVDPQSIEYIGGCGVSKTHIAQTVAAIIETYGPSALGVDDKPKLRAHLVALAEKAD